MRGVEAWLVAFLVVTTWPTVGAEATPVEVASDAAGDAEPNTIGGRVPAGLPASHLDHVDVRKVRVVKEDARYLDVRLEVARLAAKMRPYALTDEFYGNWPPDCNSYSGGHGPGSATTEYEVSWKHEEMEYTYTAHLVVYGSVAADGRFEAWTDMTAACLKRCPGSGPCDTTQVRVTLGSDSVVFHVPKPFLQFQRADQAYARSAKEFPLRAGQVLGSWTGFARTQFKADGLFVDLLVQLAQVWFKDSFTGTSSYTLATVTENSDLSLHLDEGRRPSIVIESEVQNYLVTLFNRANEKRLVRLNVEFSGAPGWEVVAPPSVTVPGNASRNVTLTVTAPPPSAARPTLRVTGESVGFPEEVASDEATLISLYVFQPGHERVYFHNMQQPHSDLFQPYADAYCTAIPCQDVRLTFAKDDPLAADPDEFVARAVPAADTKRSARTDPYSDNVPLPFIVNTTGKSHLDLRVKASQNLGTVSIHAELTYNDYSRGYNSGTLATFDAEATLGTDWQSVKIDGKIPKLVPKILAKGTYLRTDLVINQTSEGTGGPVDIHFEGGASSFFIPLKSLPKEIDPTVLSKSFQWLLPSSLDDFVNPGETRLFEPALLNHRPETHRATLRITSPLPEAWTAEVRPGEVFEIESGGVVKLGLPLRAPATAKEGERVNVTLEVRDEANQTSNVTLRVLVLEAEDVPDDVAAYEVDEDSKKRLVVDPVRKTPSVPVAFVLATLVGAGLATLRRHRRA